MRLVLAIFMNIFSIEKCWGFAVGRREEDLENAQACFSPRFFYSFRRFLVLVLSLYSVGTDRVSHKSRFFFSNDEKRTAHLIKSRVRAKANDKLDYSYAKVWER